MRNIKPIFSIFFNSSKAALLVIFIVTFLNILVQIGTYINVMRIDVISEHVISMVSYYIYFFFIGLLLAIPMINISAFPYILSHNTRRIDLFKSTVLYNTIVSVISAVMASLIYFVITTRYIVVPNYLGFGMIDPSTLTFFHLLIFNLAFFFMIINLISFFSIVAYSEGALIGIGTIFIALSLPAFFIKDIVFFFIWGGPYFKVSLLLLILTFIVLVLFKRFVFKTEVKRFGNFYK